MKKGVDYTGVCVVYFCHDGNGNLLMNKRSVNSRDEQGLWDIGGGALEFGNTIDDTIRNEIREEYCSEILNYEFLGFRDVHRENGGMRTHWVALDFKVLIDRNKVKNGEPHKFDEIKWVKFNELPKELHSQLPYFLDKYREKLW